MMSAEIIQKTQEIEEDIAYFKEIGFDHLAEKFECCLNIIKSLVENNN